MLGRIGCTRAQSIHGMLGILDSTVAGMRTNNDRFACQFRPWTAGVAARVGFVKQAPAPALPACPWWQAFAHALPSRLATLVGLATLLAPMVPAGAQTQTPTQTPVPPETVARGIALAGEAARALAPAGARIAVEAGALDPRLTLAPCAHAEPYLPAGTPAWGRTRLGLRCTDGRARWNVLLPLNVQVLAPAVVATSALPAGVPLTEAQLQRVEVDWSTSASPLFDRVEAVLGRSLSRPLLAGQPVQSAQLQARLWFATGDTVRIQASGLGYAVAGEGQALGPGVEGKAVRVQTGNGRVLIGKPVSDRCVEVVL